MWFVPHLVRRAGSQGVEVSPPGGGAGGQRWPRPLVPRYSHRVIRKYLCPRTVRFLSGQVAWCRFAAVQVGRDLPAAGPHGDFLVARALAQPDNGLVPVPFPRRSAMLTRWATVVLAINRRFRPALELL